MKIVVFGPTGRTGRAFVEQALGEGHEVVAAARHPEALHADRVGLTVIKCDILKPGEVDHVFAIAKDADAVVSALGSRPGSEGALVSGTETILASMEKYGIGRFLCVTSFGAGDSKYQMGFVVRFVIVNLFLKKALIEKDAQEKVVFDSRSDWTIVRPGGLTDGVRTGVYRVVDDPAAKPGRPVISRADVADFLLGELSAHRYSRKAVGLTY